MCLHIQKGLDEVFLSDAPPLALAAPSLGFDDDGDDDGDVLTLEVARGLTKHATKKMRLDGRKTNTSKY